MADISKIKLPDNSEYTVKDTLGRKEAYLEWGGKNFSANYGCIDAAMISNLGANRFAFLKAAGITIEYSTNGGTSWTDYGATDISKTGLFGKGMSFYLGNHNTAGTSTLNDMLRVTISTSPAGLYTTLNKIAIYMSTSGNTVQVLMEKALESTPTTYITHLDWTGISGWSGWNILNISGVTTYGNTAASQYGRLRFTFKQTAINSGAYTAASISRIMGFGGVGWSVPSNMAADGHLYAYDNGQNATFPANITASQITATQFNGKATDVATTGAATNGVARHVWFSDSSTETKRAYNDSLKYTPSSNTISANISGNAANVTGTVAVANGGTGKTNGKDAANYFMNALDTGSSTPVDADYYISQYVGGGTTTTTYHRRPVSALWTYIKDKISSILGLTATNYGGTSAKATADASGNTITSYYAPKSTAVTNVALATNKITKTINGSTTDVVTAATTSAYGITKLNTATNSTSTTEAATPSAVKIAKDRADEAYTKAATVESGLNGTLIYDHSYTISNGVATFTPHVYLKGEEVTSNYAKSCFVWKYKLANDVTGTPSYIPLTTNNDRTCTVTISVLGYGGYVLGEFTPA